MKKTIFYCILLMCLQRACASQNKEKERASRLQALEAYQSNLLNFLHDKNQKKNSTRKLACIIGTKIDVERAYGKVTDK